jgi:hypothetical protein
MTHYLSFADRVTESGIREPWEVYVDAAIEQLRNMNVADGPMARRSVRDCIQAAISDLQHALEQMEQADET